MARPKKEEKLKHKNYITLKLTDIELACLEQSAEALNISRVEYLRNLILEKPMIYKYEVVADNEQLNVYSGKTGHPSRRDGMLFRFKLYTDSSV